MPPLPLVPTPVKALKTLVIPAELSALSDELKEAGKCIGFVPTMGALHDGHLSLIRKAKSECDVVISSIFVNPTQFNDPKDFERYPRVVEEDRLMLASAGCDVLFLPTVEGIYPDDSSRTVVSFGFLESILEGAHRPGHFSGVGMVVKRLFEIVKPDKAFFGQKDYQQVMIIRSLVEQFHLPVEIVAMPTVREKDGLAMSSRNRLLNETERETALVISRVLQKTKENFHLKSIEELHSDARKELDECEGLRLEYFTICKGETLEVLRSKSESARPVALIAAYVGKVRLIDNMELL